MSYHNPSSPVGSLYALQDDGPQPRADALDFSHRHTSNMKHVRADESLARKGSCLVLQILWMSRIRPALRHEHALSFCEPAENMNV
ncbi:16267_t:CDS:2 [Acaulospora colombiana]|uniref:16267_t:CDS:1 n=1 Tax=Acaulospora colombiana TaxID=27376 RepID=A0ACA9N197_9GLOM|nr:16267_t:CDS:2 [Acaulospora colombiana]